VRVALASTITEVIHAKTAHEIDEVRRLFREHEAYLNVDLCFQEFESELANLPGKYVPPFGTLLLAMNGRKSIGKSER
jgi:putative acetyltransferase